MDFAYLHIVTNHIPIIGVPLAVVVLLMGVWRKSDDLKSAAFLIFAGMGLATLATFLLGQGGEDFVEEVAGVSKDALHEHEDFAKLALASVALTAALSLFAVLRYQGLSFLRRRITSSERLVGDEVSAVSVSCFSTWMTLAVLLFALLSVGVLGFTGKLGGMVRHSEFYDRTQTTTDQNTEEADTEYGKGRRRNRGKE